MTSKYHKTIKGVTVDVYDVLVAFNVTCPARQHAIKKLLMAGQRGGKGELQDLNETAAAGQRAIELVPPLPNGGAGTSFYEGGPLVKADFAEIEKRAGGMVADAYASRLKDSAPSGRAREYAIEKNADDRSPRYDEKQEADH